MYNYKINNSYTVYVNWAYYKEVETICKKQRSFSTSSSKAHGFQKRSTLFQPLQIGASVSSKHFGSGTVCSTTEDGIMSVQFNERVVRFLFPEAVKQGHLILN